MAGGRGGPAPWLVRHHGRVAFVAKGLTKRFGPVVALAGLDCAVGPGEVFGYLGPNGAGKTTTIRLALGALRPTSGVVRVLGASPRDPVARRRIGYLPADLHVDPRYTANDVLECFGALRGGLDRAWVDELLERFELDPTRPFRELSSGNRRKVGVVQAFAHRPELVILDEPTSGLDPLLQHEFRRLVREAASDGAAVFLSSHVLDEVEALADRVGILRSGRLVDVSTVAVLRNRARQRIELHLGGPAPVGVFEGVPGVCSVRMDGDVVGLEVEGSVDAVVKAAAALDVRRIVTVEADLEDVFLAYYRGGDR